MELGGLGGGSAWRVLSDLSNVVRGNVLGRPATLVGWIGLDRPAVSVSSKSRGFNHLVGFVGGGFCNIGISTTTWDVLALSGAAIVYFEHFVCPLIFATAFLRFPALGAVGIVAAPSGLVNNTPLYSIYCKDLFHRIEISIELSKSRVERKIERNQIKHNRKEAVPQICCGLEELDQRTTDRSIIFINSQSLQFKQKWVRA